MKTQGFGAAIVTKGLGLSRTAIAAAEALHFGHTPVRVAFGTRAGPGGFRDVEDSEPGHACCFAMGTRTRMP